MSSIPYQIFLYFNAWYLALFFCLEIGCMIYKGILLPYPEVVLASDITLLAILLCLSFIQTYFGYKGNQLENVLLMILFVLMSLPVLGGLLYFLLWQTYVLWLEVITALIEIGIIATEMLFAVISLITFSRVKKS